MTIYVINEYDNFQEFENFRCEKAFKSLDEAKLYAKELFYKTLKSLKNENGNYGTMESDDNEYFEAVFGDNDFLYVVKIDEIKLMKIVKK